MKMTSMENISHEKKGKTKQQNRPRESKQHRRIDLRRLPRFPISLALPEADGLLYVGESVATNDRRTWRRQVRRRARGDLATVHRDRPTRCGELARGVRVVPASERSRAACAREREVLRVARRMARDRLV